MATVLEKAGRVLGNAVVRPLSSHSNRNGRHWLFGHQHGEFAGNAKFLFLYLLLHRPDIKPMWITHRDDVEAHLRTNGLPVCRSNTPGGVRASLQSGVYLYCHGPEDVSVTFGAGAVLVNLWHGVGLKAIQFGDARSNARRYSDPAIGWLKRTYGLASRLDPDLLITTSPFTASHFAGQFRMPLERCPPCGYPRLDVALDAKLAAMVSAIDGAKVAALRRERPAEVYVYAPTFRDSVRDFLADALPDPARLNAVLEARNALLYVKLHPHTPVPASWPFARTRRWPPDLDIYSSLSQIDALITDYSSLHYDWIFYSSRGAVLYAPDAEEYARHDRSLLYPFEDNVAGKVARSFDDLLALLASGEALLADPDLPLVRERFWGHEQGPASARVIAAVERFLG